MEQKSSPRVMRGSLWTRWKARISLQEITGEGASISTCEKERDGVSELCTLSRTCRVALSVTTTIGNYIMFRSAN